MTTSSFQSIVSFSPPKRRPPGAATRQVERRGGPRTHRSADDVFSDFPENADPRLCPCRRCRGSRWAWSSSSCRRISRTTRIRRGQFYDALPDPVGWLLVLSGLRGLRGRTSTSTSPRWLGWVALAVSVPLWFPQVNHLLVPEYNDAIGVSFQWFLVPAADRLQPRPGPRGRPAAEQPGAARSLRGRPVRRTHLGLRRRSWSCRSRLRRRRRLTGQPDADRRSGVVNVVFVYYLFRVHRREWLGGPGPARGAPPGRQQRALKPTRFPNRTGASRTRSRSGSASFTTEVVNPAIRQARRSG